MALDDIPISPVFWTGTRGTGPVWWCGWRWLKQSGLYNLVQGERVWRPDPKGRFINFRIAKPSLTRCSCRHGVSHGGFFLSAHNGCLVIKRTDPSQNVVCVWKHIPSTTHIANCVQKFRTLFPGPPGMQFR